MTDEEPFKEWFRHILPPLLEEVRTHVNDMLQAGAIRPSSSPWCNVVVLIHKKDSGLHFCIDFRKLNMRTKKDSYPLPSHPGNLGKPGGVPYILKFWLQVRFLAGRDGQGI